MAGYSLEPPGGPPGVEAMESARNGFEVGIKVKAFAPDVVLLDLMMPGVDGFALCRQVEADPGIRVVAITGYPTLENRERVLEAGAEACLAKPFDPILPRETLRLPLSPAKEPGEGVTTAKLRPPWLLRVTRL